LSVNEQIVTRAGGLLKEGDQVNAVVDMREIAHESLLPIVKQN
jgi:hypothetical protein